MKTRKFFFDDFTTLLYLFSDSLDDVIHFGFVKPLDEKKLHKICDKFSTIITVEDGLTKGSFGSSIFEFAAKNDYVNEIFLCGVPHYFI
ncbi:transketolase C-terminal domain-containing protein [Flavobacterium sp. 25HG05S-40]|uniref:transketolase C-terminal domain-containing protein n=1 Tax=Flavobacterium sp. 25HG05S-40 TaxID=3458682 RepID=UPI004044F3A1